MTTSDQLKALVLSHADGDDSQFYAVAMQVAAAAARAGQTKFAHELRDLVDKLQVKSASTAAVAPVVAVRENSSCGKCSFSFKQTHETSLETEYSENSYC